MRIGLLHNFFRFKYHIALEFLFQSLQEFRMAESDIEIIDFSREFKETRTYFAPTYVEKNVLCWNEWQTGKDLEGILNPELLHVDVMLGFEMSPSICGWLESHGVRYLNFYTHPVRFLPDMLWAVATKDRKLQEKLSLWNFDYASQAFKYAHRVAAMTVIDQAEQMAFVPAGTAVIFGQTEQDSSVIVDGKFHSLFDEREKIRELTQNAEEILVVPHPLAVDHISLVSLLQFLGRGKICSFSSYALLCSPQVSQVLTLSSSLGIESRFFGKKTDFLLGPALRAGGPMVPAGSKVFTLGQELLHKEFWQSLFREGGIPERHEAWTIETPDFVRKAINGDAASKDKRPSRYFFGWLSEAEKKSLVRAGYQTREIHALLMVDFREASPWRDWSGIGISLEDDGLYTTEKRVELALPAYDMLQSGSLVLRVQPVLLEKESKQVVRVLLQDAFLGVLTLSVPEEVLLVVPCRIPQGETERFVLTMEFPNAVSPKKLGINEDIRQLALIVRNISYRADYEAPLHVEKIEPELSLPGTDESIEESEEEKACEAELEQEQQEDIRAEIVSFEERMKKYEDALASLSGRFQALEQSKLWRLYQKMHTVKVALLPQGTKRWLLAKLIYKTVVSPKYMFGQLNRENIKKLYMHLKNESAVDVMERIDMRIPTGDFSEKLKLLPLETEQRARIEDYSPLTFSTIPQPKVSIIIPVYNQFSYTYLCLCALLENSGDVPYEVILADDGSTDFTKEIEKIVSGVRVVRSGSNLGFLKNCNYAAGKAKGEYLLFLNNDTQVQPGWLAPLVQLLDEHEDIGMTGSKLLYPDGRLQEAGGIFWQDGSAWNYGHGDNPDLPQYRYVKDVDYISGASILVRRNLWMAIYGFDERFAPAYCEDSDLAFSIRAKGYRVTYQPISVVVHFEGISNGRDVKNGTKKYQVVNANKFYQKWKSVLEKENFPTGKNVFLARDRSRGKKTIVVIDHYVPHYDQDAGSRTTWSYLCLFVKMGFHVVFVGDNYFPHQPYTQQLEQMGIEVFVGEGINISRFKEWVRENKQYIDYFYLNRPHISVKYIDFLKQCTRAKIFYYGHDLHFIREQRQYEIEKDKNLIKSIAHWKKIESSLITKADVVYTAGSYEEHVLRNLFPDKRIRAIPIFCYEKVQLDAMEIAPLEGRENLLFVGGFGHKPNEDAAVWFVREIFPLILMKAPETKLYIVGSHPTEKIKLLSSEHVIVTGFVSDEKLSDYYRQVRVCVVPLRYGAGVKGKVLEAMCNGVPLVTTPIGAEGLPNCEACLSIVEITKIKEYAQSVLRLLHDDAQWQSLSKKERAYIYSNFTTECAKKIMMVDWQS